MHDDYHRSKYLVCTEQLGCHLLTNALVPLNHPSEAHSQRSRILDAPICTHYSYCADGWCCLLVCRKCWFISSRTDFHWQSWELSCCLPTNCWQAPFFEKAICTTFWWTKMIGPALNLVWNPERKIRWWLHLSHIGCIEQNYYFPPANGENQWLIHDDDDTS